MLADQVRTHENLGASAQLLHKVLPGLRLALLDQLILERSLRRFPLIVGGQRAAGDLEDISVAVERKRTIGDCGRPGQQGGSLQRLVEFADAGDRTVGAREIARGMQRKLGGGG